MSAEPVLTEEIAGLARAVADRYAGTLADVLRLAIPQRHAATEASSANAAPGEGSAASTGAGHRALIPAPGPGTRRDRRSSARSPRAARPARPGRRFPVPAWPEEVARAAVTTASAGRGAVIVVPDARDLARVDEALAALTPRQVRRTRPPRRLRHAYRRARPRRTLPPLARRPARRGHDRRGHPGCDVRARYGTSAWWCSGTTATTCTPSRMPRTPTRGRSSRCAPTEPGAAALIGGFARTTELTQLVTAGWARPLGPDRQTLRATAPRVRPAADDKELRRTRPP